MATTELIKKVLYTGVGVVTTTADKVKTKVEEIQNQNEDVQTEGKKIVDEFMGDMKDRRQNVEGKFKSIVDKVLNQFDLPNRTEAEALNAKVAELEEKLAAKKKTVKRTVRKAVNKVAETK